MSHTCLASVRKVLVPKSETCSTLRQKGDVSVIHSLSQLQNLGEQVI